MPSRVLGRHLPEGHRLPSVPGSWPRASPLFRVNCSLLLRSVGLQALVLLGALTGLTAHHFPPSLCSLPSALWWENRIRPPAPDTTSPVGPHTQSEARV